MPTIGQDVEAVIQDVVSALRALGADLEKVGLVRNVVAAIQQGNFAPLLVGAATVLKDAEAAATAIEHDVAAIIPEDAKAFIAGTGVLTSTLTAPMLGTVTGVFFRGTLAQLVDALAKGQAQLLKPGA